MDYGIEYSIIILFQVLPKITFGDFQIDLAWWRDLVVLGLLARDQLLVREKQRDFLGSLLGDHKAWSMLMCNVGWLDSSGKLVPEAPLASLQEWLEASSVSCSYSQELPSCWRAALDTGQLPASSRKSLLEKLLSLCLYTPMP